ncbi:MAG: hypothetical protein MI748_00090 [Opitutales bacterium]|nr:hypothetical protein [Opitutales bacterium]
MGLFIEVLVFAFTLYGVIGFAFALIFIIFGLSHSDPMAEKASPWFKSVIIPGLALLWPLFAIRWIIGVRRPPQERNAHRIAAKTYHNR